MNLPAIGTCAQFIRTTHDEPHENILTACLIVGHEPTIKNARGESVGLLINYRDKRTGNVIERAHITAHDLVSDEDAVTHDFSA